ncbi:hypothetical protein E3N88_01639 [Mikania micrantha]|uniref:Uncharacterized protein n=1 Tax=Mikania micrantha TaxID=192012 RepID=A0A5N6Q248_9ASTR|nr:hypothetical protein E3N88_01639 [Mikania micrantha]
MIKRSTSNYEAVSVDHSFLVLQVLNSLIELIHTNNELGNRVQDPVKHERSRYKQRVALALHDRFLVMEMIGGQAVHRFAAGPGFVLPVDVQQQEDAKRDDGEEGFEEAGCNGDQAFPEGAQAGKS